MTIGKSVRFNVAPGLTWMPHAVDLARPVVYDCNMVRWENGHTIPIGGWEALTLAAGTAVTVTGAPRALYSWEIAGVSYLAIGTHSKAYIYSQGVLTDITPVGFVAGNADDTLSAGNYGSGTYNVNVYGESSAALATAVPAAVWHFDIFGNYLVGCCSPNDGKLYYWDGNLANKFVQMPGSPTSCQGVVVTPERMVVGLQAGGQLRKLQWSDRETYNSWTPTETNTAGDHILDGPGKIIAARRGRQETLIWTDDELWAMRYIGGNSTYRLEKLGSACGPVSANSMVVTDSFAVWMGKHGFFIYDGQVRQLECPLLYYLYQTGNNFAMNESQRGKITAGVNPQYSEIWFSYPTGSALDVGRTVIWNFRENWWSHIAKERSAFNGNPAFPVPIGATWDGSTGYIWKHETGWATADLSTKPFIWTSYFALDDGGRRTFVSRARIHGERGDQIFLRLYGFNSDTWYAAPGIGSPTHGFDTGEKIQTSFWIDLRGTARYIQCKIGVPAGYANTRWSFTGLTLDIQPDQEN